MLPYLFLLGAMTGSAMNNIVNSEYTRRNAARKNISGIYNVVVTGSASLYWLVLFLTDFSFEPKVLLFSLFYGIFYTMAFLGLFFALSCGSVSLTAFVKQLSLIAVSFWGFFFWDTPLNVTTIIGMLLIILALYLCFKPDKAHHGHGVSLKWVFFSCLLLVGNAGCSITQKYQQMIFDKQHGNMFMFFGVLISALVSGIIYLRGEKCRVRDLARHTILYPMGGGLCSGFLNLFIMLLINSTMSESIIFPGIAVGGLIITTIYSLVVYKEELYPRQWAGLGVGALALVFLNL